MRQIANNTFNGGVMMDMQPLTTPNTVLTDCLNGTLITYDGNEFVLQSDDGNGKVGRCKLDKDFIPLGMKEYGGIIYIVSQNPFTGECEIGSFPSPETMIFNSNEKDDEKPHTLLQSKDVYESGYTKGITKQTVKLDFVLGSNTEKQLLRPGDKFAIYLTDEEDTNESFLTSDKYKIFEDLLEKYDNLQLETRNLFKLKLVRISEDGTTESIKEIVPSFKSNGTFYYNKSDLLFNDDENRSSEGNFAVYNNKINGYLAVILELEQIDEFDLSIGNDIKVTEKNDKTNEPLKFKFDFDVISKVDKDCKNNISGLEITTTDIDSNNSETICYNIPNLGLKDWILSDGKIFKYPEKYSNDEEYTAKDGEVRLKSTFQKEFDVNSNIKVEIKPYSKFNYFNNLAYENIINYNKLAYTQESTIWKYYLDRSMNTDIQPDKVLLSFDFFVRNTENKRNKLDAMYIEFYDVIANASLFYPISSISDSKSISIDCFTDLPVRYESNGGVSEDKLTSELYYLLINKNKTDAYNSALKNIDSKGDYTEIKKLCSDYDNNKHVSSVIALKSVFQNSENLRRFDNLGIQKKEFNNKLRSDNFYLVAICGIDFYSDNKNYEYKTYICYNFLWTTGVFNKYWALSGSDNLNFNAKKYPDFLEIGFNKLRDTWSDFTTVGELSSNKDTDNDNNENSFQSYTEPYFKSTSTKEDFNTRINIHGEIGNQYKLSIDTNKSILNYGKVIIEKENITYSDIESSKSLTTDDYEIQEDNNESSLTTDSKVKTVSIKDLSGGNNLNPANGLDIKFNVFSNRKIQVKSTLDGLYFPDYVYTKFAERYPNQDIFPTTMVVIAGQGRTKSRYFWLDKTSTFVTQVYDDAPTGFNKDDCWLFEKSADSGEFYERLNKVAPSDCYLFRMFADTRDAGVEGYTLDKFNSSDKYENYNNRLFIVVNGMLLPLYYICGDSSTFTTIVNSLNGKIKNEYYFRSINNSVLTPAKVPNKGLIYNHTNFNTTFNLNVPIVKATTNNDGISVFTYYHGVEKKLSDLYDNFKSLASNNSEDYVNIGTLFNSETDLYKDNLPNQDLNTNIVLEDKYVLNGNNFILTISDYRYTINNIIEILNNPQEYVRTDELPNTWHGGTVFDSTLFIKNDSDTADDARGYTKIQFRYDPTNGLSFQGSFNLVPYVQANVKDRQSINQYVDMFPKTTFTDKDDGDNTFKSLRIANVTTEKIWQN